MSTEPELENDRPRWGVLIALLVAAVVAVGWYVAKDWGTRKQIQRWPDGSLRRELRVKPHPVMTWVDHGPFTSYYEGGRQVSETGGMKEGNLDGLLTQYYESGVKKSESTWKDGRIVGKPKFWDRSGEPTENPEEPLPAELPPPAEAAK